MSKLLGYNIVKYTDLINPETFKKGDMVFKKIETLGQNYHIGKIISIQSDPDILQHKRLKIKYPENYLDPPHAIPKALMSHKEVYPPGDRYFWCSSATKIMTQPKNIVICRETVHYRLLARTQSLPQDMVLEIGCDVGVTLAILTKHTKSAIGLDKSGMSLHTCRNRYPQANVHLFNIFHQNMAVWKDNAQKVWLDINSGSLTKKDETVEIALEKVIRELEPDQIFLRSRELHEHYFPSQDEIKFVKKSKAAREEQARLKRERQDSLFFDEK